MSGPVLTPEGVQAPLCYGALTPCRPRLAPGGDCQGGLMPGIAEGKKAAQGGPLAFPLPVANR